MKSLNTVTLLGNVTRDVETKSTSTGRLVATFGLATNRVWTDASGKRQSTVEFHTIVCWSRLAELCTQYVRKGKPLLVTGHLKTRSWESGGTKHFRTDIVADDIVLLGSKEQESAVEYPATVQEETDLDEVVA